jgi:protein-arginine kinase activator protein McsA
MYLRRQGEEHVTSSCRNQPGGLGKHAGRSIKRTDAAPKLRIRRLLLAETVSWVATRSDFEEAWNRCVSTMGWRSGPPG